MKRVTALATVAGMTLLGSISAAAPSQAKAPGRNGQIATEAEDLPEPSGGSAVMRRSLLAFVLFVLAACSSTGSSTVGASTSPSATSSVSETPRPPLVGQWALKKTCDMIVQALTRAGLENLIPLDVGETFKLPENAPLPSSWDPAHPCEDAKAPTEHSHTFWPDGEFNSYDQYGQEVDNGPYEIVNDHTFVIGGHTPTTFHYRIRGDTIKFDVVVPKDCTTKHCLRVVAWAFSVANPGQEWTRVTSGPNAP
jgi:hypothetical protein